MATPSTPVTANDIETIVIPTKRLISWPTLIIRTIQIIFMYRRVYFQQCARVYHFTTAVLAVAHSSHIAQIAEEHAIRLRMGVYKNTSLLEKRELPRQRQRHYCKSAGSTKSEVEYKFRMPTSQRVPFYNVPTLLITGLCPTCIFRLKAS